MNKVFVGMILAVCVLGMALVLLNERFSRKTETPAILQNAPTAEIVHRELVEPVAPPQIPQPEAAPVFQAAPEAAEEAAAALAPPVKEPEAAPEPASAALLAEANSVQLANEAQQPVQEPKLPPAEKPAEPAVQAPRHEPPRAQKPAAPRTITNFVVFARENGATVRLAGSSRLNYKSMTLDNPHRVVIDLDGDWQFPQRLAVPKNELVSSVRVGKIDGKTRVVVDLKQKPRLVRVIAAKNGDGLDLRVDR